MKKYAILGHPVSHSLSPKIHNAVFKELALEDREYVFCDTPPEQLAQIIQDMREGKWEGFSVTIPHKQTVMPLLDELTDRAQKVGAVNTVLRTVVQNRERGEEVRLVGDNTDYVGFEKSLEEAGVVGGDANSVSIGGQNFTPQHVDNVVTIKNTLVLGYGGAAQAIIAVLLDHGFQVTVASRTPSREDAIHHVSTNVVSYNELSPSDPWSLIVNTTPVGMHPKEGKCILTDPNWFTADRIYVDIIYTPKMTEFLRRAKKAGGTIVSGDRMFLWQAFEQAMHFTGSEPTMKLVEGLNCFED